MSDTIARSGDGRCSNQSEVGRVVGQYGLEALDDDAIRLARALAANLISEHIASADTFIAVQRIVGNAVFGCREANALTGLLACFPVTKEGCVQIMRGDFDAVDVDLGLIAAPGEAPAAYYGWGYAASTKEGGRAVVKASLHVQRELYWALPTFARAVTDAGKRSLCSIGFTPFSETDASLLWIPACDDRDEMAA